MKAMLECETEIHALFFAAMPFLGVTMPGRLPPIKRA